jgi:hypothetical protein
MLLSSNTIKNRAFWHVQILVQGEIYVPVEWVEEWLAAPDQRHPPLIPGQTVGLDEFTTLQAVDQLTQLSGLSRATTSMLKCRLLWKDWSGERCVDFDLGAGVDVILPPAHYVNAELLLPVAGSELQLPPELRDQPLGFGCAVIARADCVPTAVERDRNLTFTDTVYLDREGAAGADGSVLIPRRKDSNRYEVTGDAVPLGSTFPLWDRNPPGSAVDALGRFVVGRSMPVPAGDGAGRGATTQVTVAIPGNANAFLLQLDNTVVRSTVSLIQELSF